MFTPMFMNAYLFWIALWLCQFPVFFNTLSKTHAMFRSSMLANYIVWQLVRDFESVLPEPFELAKSKFASVLYGVRGAAPRWRRCVDRLNTAMMFVVGSLYVDEHFSSGDKKKVCRDSLKHLKHYRLRYACLTLWRISLRM